MYLLAAGAKFDSRRHSHHIVICMSSRHSRCIHASQLASPYAYVLFDTGYHAHLPVFTSRTDSLSSRPPNLLTPLTASVARHRVSVPDHRSVERKCQCDHTALSSAIERTIEVGCGRVSSSGGSGRKDVATPPLMHELRRASACVERVGRRGLSHTSACSA